MAFCRLSQNRISRQNYGYLIPRRGDISVAIGPFCGHGHCWVRQRGRTLIHMESACSSNDPCPLIDQMRYEIGIGSTLPSPRLQVAGFPVDHRPSAGINWDYMPYHFKSELVRFINGILPVRRCCGSRASDRTIGLFATIASLEEGPAAQRYWIYRSYGKYLGCQEWLLGSAFILFYSIFGPYSRLHLRQVFWIIWANGLAILCSMVRCSI